MITRPIEISSIMVIQEGDVPGIDEKQFEQLFKQYYHPLYAYAYTINEEDEAAEEVVQTIFLKLWEKKETMQIHTSWKAYLYKAVYHESLNAKKHRRIRLKFMQAQAGDGLTPGEGSEKELQNQLNVALRHLPDKCRQVFQLSRFEDLKYQEIADRLKISTKTVEAHMGKALKILRVQLADFLTTTVFLLIKLLT